MFVFSLRLSCHFPQKNDGFLYAKPNCYKMADSKNWSLDPWPSASYSYPKNYKHKQKYICWDSTIYYTIFSKAQQEAKKKDILSRQGAVAPFSWQKNLRNVES